MFHPLVSRIMLVGCITDEVSFGALKAQLDAFMALAWYQTVDQGQMYSNYFSPIQFRNNCYGWTVGKDRWIVNIGFFLALLGRGGIRNAARSPYLGHVQPLPSDRFP